MDSSLQPGMVIGGVTLIGRGRFPIMWECLCACGAHIEAWGEVLLLALQLGQRLPCRYCRPLHRPNNKE